MGTFPSEAPLQYRNKTSEISKIYWCNIKKYVKKLIKLFDSWIENSHRNILLDRKFPPQHEHYVSCNMHK